MIFMSKYMKKIDSGVFFGGFLGTPNHENPVPGASGDVLGRLLDSLGSPSKITGSAASATVSRAQAPLGEGV